MAKTVYRQLRTDSWWGGGGKSFLDRSLLAFQTLPELPPLDDRSYDIFISYKNARHADAAQRLADLLIGKGYSVWFDKHVLDRMEKKPEVFETDYLLAILRHAVTQSSCTIIFEGQLHAVALGPGDTEEKLLKKRRLMQVNGVTVIWDWHGIEISATEWGLTIHPDRIVAFQQKGGKVLWSTNHFYNGEKEGEKAIDAALDAVASAIRR